MFKIDFPATPSTYSLHNHSDFSDGATPPEALCAAAKCAGIRVLGISDHLVIHPTAGKDFCSWSMKHDRIAEYIDTLLALKQKYEDDHFTLKIGLEVDFFFENHLQVAAGLADYPIDYLIGSVHYCGTFPVDHSVTNWEPLSREERAEVCEMYWQKLYGAAASGMFSFIGHPDLPKKFLQIDPEKYFCHAVKLLDIIAQHGIGIELNTAGYFKPCAEQYPSKKILCEAALRHIPVTITADAHTPEHLQRNYPEAFRLLAQAGYEINGSNF